MYKLYSRFCEHTIRALAVLTEEEAAGRFRVGDLSRRSGVKESIAKKGFQKLSQAGLLDAVTGPNGGYRLNRAPALVTLRDIVTAVDGEDPYQRCVLGLPACDDDQPCSFHNEWKELKQKVLASLKKKNLRDILKISGKKHVDKS